MEVEPAVKEEEEITEEELQATLNAAGKKKFPRQLVGKKYDLRAFSGRNRDRLLDRIFDGRISDRKGEHG